MTLFQNFCLAALGSAIIGLPVTAQNQEEQKVTLSFARSQDSCNDPSAGKLRLQAGRHHAWTRYRAHYGA
jgi:hypothetical protein